MEDILLTTKEVAELKNCTQRHIRDLCTKGALQAIATDVQGRGNKTEYRIPLATLPQSLQLKYKRKQRKATEQTQVGLGMPMLNHLPAPIDHEQLTQREREEIALWKGIIREWHLFRSLSSKLKTEANEDFIALTNDRLEREGKDIVLTIKTLYKKDKALKTEGESGLVNKTGKHGNHKSKVTQEMRDIFEHYYLDKNKPAITQCTKLTQQELINRYGDTAPTVPSSRTFERVAKRIPTPYVMYWREGRETYMSKCAPYISRMYDDLASNEIWVGDGHRVDVMVRGKDGKPFRPYLSAFMDVRTRKFVGWVVTETLSGDSTIYALKHGAERFGLPQEILVDNGREYLFTEFSGDAGFRKKAKKSKDKFAPPTILESLDIKIRTSIPANPRGKGIERAFNTVKEQFSKLFKGYTGGNILEKPDDLQDYVKSPEKLIGIDEFIKYVDAYIEGIYNRHPHTGEGMWGQSPDQAFADNFIEKRVVPKDQLHLMFMRHGKGTVKVQKNGVTVKLYGQPLQYDNKDLWKNHFGEDVYVRYDPRNLETVRVYDTSNKFLYEATLVAKASYKATKEELQALTKKQKDQEKAVKEYKKIKGVQVQDAFDAMLDEAAATLEKPVDFHADVLKIIRSEGNRPQVLPKAAGAEDIGLYQIDFQAAAQRAREERLNRV